MKNGKESHKIISIDADKLSIEFFDIASFKESIGILKKAGFEIFATEKTASQLKPRINQPEEVNDYEIYNKYSRIMRRTL